MIGQAMANAAPAVAPFGGRSRVMGTNPMAWAVPRAADAPPVCLDVATAGVAEGKLRVARARGFPVPAGNIVDREGRPTTEPGDFYAGGALLPFGGHKGSGFSLLAQFIGRGLAQMDPSDYDGPRGVNGPFILAIDIARFTDLERFRAEVEAQCAAVTGSLPAEGWKPCSFPVSRSWRCVPFASATECQSPIRPGKSWKRWRGSTGSRCQPTPWLRAERRSSIRGRSGVSDRLPPIASLAVSAGAERVKSVRQ